MSMVLISSMILALTGVKLYSPNSFPLLQMTPLILPKRTSRVMLLPMVLLADNDCARPAKSPDLGRRLLAFSLHC